MPITNIGNGCQIFANGFKKGAHAQKIRETAEDIPTAWTLKLVGYNSDVIR